MSLELPSSSPAFSTAITPICPAATTHVPQPSILPIVLGPTTLRPLAFRTFTKKHNLTLTSSALQLLAKFIGKACGSGWREDGLAEKVLDDIARSWKRIGGGVIVTGDGDELAIAISCAEGAMSGSRLKTLSNSDRAKSRGSGEENFAHALATRMEGQRVLAKSDKSDSTELHIEESTETRQPPDPRAWTRIVGAFDQPRLKYDSTKKHFESISGTPSLFPSAAHKTKMFRDRYSLIYQRLLRNESFQTPLVSSAQKGSMRQSASNVMTVRQAYKLTPIANLLGRNGSSHILLGLLAVSPTGHLILNDPTGSILLDVQHTRPIPADGAWFTPGMIVLVDGLYEEKSSNIGFGLDDSTGIGGMIGGRLIAFSIGGPPCERRNTTLGLNSASANGKDFGGGFGWVDFLGVGSERATGAAMRSTEQSVFGQRSSSKCYKGRGRVIIVGEVNLDDQRTLRALRKILARYSSEATDCLPMILVLVGNFARHSVMSGGNRNGSVEYKEYFDILASLLLEYSMLLCNATFVFVPGHHDPWASSFSAGASPLIPRAPVPDIFTSRIKRAFTTANNEAEKSTGIKHQGEAVWSTNPTRLTLFGPVQEIVIYRDDTLGRLRRNAVTFETSSSTLRPDPRKSDTISDDGPRDYVDMENGHHVVPDGVVQMAEPHAPSLGFEGKPPDLPTPDVQLARKLVKTILDQGHLSPFPLSQRPVLWDYAGSLHLYPLPTALVLVDPEAPPFAISYQGCLVMNPGSLTSDTHGNLVQWVEFDASTKQGVVQEERI